MNIESQIDATLRLLGSVEPPAGLERRVNARLDAPRPRFSTRQYLSAGAIAAGIAVAFGALSVALQDRARYQDSSLPRMTAHPVETFGAASAVHVPTKPIAVPPIPVAQGRGRSRSHRAMSAAGRPLPRGVAAPRTPAPLSPATPTGPE